MSDSFDSKLRKKRRNALRDGRKEYSLQIKKNRKEEIYDIIVTYSLKEEGINQTSLSRLTGIDRWYLADLLDVLIKEGRIKKEPGKHGVYTTVEDFLKHPLLDAELFGREFLSKILKAGEYQVLNDKKASLSAIKTSYNKEGQLVQNIYDVDFTHYKKFYEPKFGPKDGLAKIMFEFSNLVGAYVTYCIIQAINSDNYDFKNKTELTPAVLNEFTKKYMIKSVGDISPYLIIRFQDYIRKDLPDLPKTDTLDSETIRKLLNDFCWLYPLVNFNFEKSRGKPYIFEPLIHDTKDSYIEYYKKERSIYYQQLKTQEKCKHRFDGPKYNESVNAFIIMCPKCGLYRRVKK